MRFCVGTLSRPVGSLTAAVARDLVVGAGGGWPASWAVPAENNSDAAIEMTARPNMLRRWALPAHVVDMLSTAIYPKLLDVVSVGVQRREPTPPVRSRHAVRR